MGYRGITDLTEVIGLKDLTDLDILKLTKNKLTEIKGLETLTNLQELDLGFNKIVKIQGLETLTNLKKLNLSYNNIHNIGGLETLINLENLYLTRNYIRRIKSLNTLSKLKELRLYDNPVSIWTKEKFKEQKWPLAVVEYCQEKNKEEQLRDEKQLDTLERQMITRQPNELDTPPRLLNIKIAGGLCGLAITFLVLVLVFSSLGQILVSNIFYLILDIILVLIIMVSIPPKERFIPRNLAFYGYMGTTFTLIIIFPAINLVLVAAYIIGWIVFDYTGKQTKDEAYSNLKYFHLIRNNFIYQLQEEKKILGRFPILLTLYGFGEQIDLAIKNLESKKKIDSEFFTLHDAIFDTIAKLNKELDNIKESFDRGDITEEEKNNQIQKIFKIEKLA